MADDPLRELLTSPLEEDAKRTRAPRPERDRPAFAVPGGVWLVAGLVAGALAVLGGYLIGGGDEPAAAPDATAAITSTTTITPAAAVVALPPGYAAVDDGRLGIKVERILLRSDATFVTVSTVVPSGIDGEDSAGFQGGSWELELTGGQVLSSNTEAQDPASPGFVTIRFDAGSYGADDLVALRMIGNGIRTGDRVSTTASGTFTITDDGAPVEVPLTVDSFALDAGVTLALPSFEVGTERGLLAWQLQGSDTEAVATVSPHLTIVNTGTGTVIPTIAQGDFGGFVFLSPGNSFFQDAQLSRQGEVGFTPANTDVQAFPTGVALSADLEIGVSWLVYTPVDVEITIDANVEVAVVE